MAVRGDLDCRSRLADSEDPCSIVAAFNESTWIQVRFSRSPQNIGHAKREFLVGNLYINRKITGALVDRQPFGGFKLSGMGSKAGGPDYLLQFMVPRTITENTMRRGFAPADTTTEHAGV
jgi:delta 1-pyrroline-5-carboxylate dehydrogenase